MREAPQITITHREDLRKFFPELEVNKFEKLSGGKKYHGPCPICGGTDRFNVWYWASQGLWMAGCSQGDHVKNLKGEWRKTICLNYLSGTTGMELSPAEVRQIEAARKAAEQAEWAEKLAKYKEISLYQTNGMYLADFYHSLLVDHPEIIADLLEHDGLTLDTLNYFKIGYNPQFDVYHKDDDSTESFEAITIPSYHWLCIDGKWDHWLTNIRHRLLGASKDKYRPLVGGLGVDYFNAYIQGCDRMVILEGEKKAMRLWQEGVPTAGIWGVDAWYDWWIQEWKRMAPLQICVLFDHEADPKKQQEIWNRGERLVAAINSKGAWIASQILLPEIGKIDDQLNQGVITVDQLFQLLDSASPVQIH